MSSSTKAFFQGVLSQFTELGRRQPSLARISRFQAATAAVKQFSRGADPTEVVLIQGSQLKRELVCVLHQSTHASAEDIRSVTSMVSQASYTQSQLLVLQQSLLASEFPAHKAAGCYVQVEYTQEYSPMDFVLAQLIRAETQATLNADMKGANALQEQVQTLRSLSD